MDEEARRSLNKAVNVDLDEKGKMGGWCCAVLARILSGVSMTRCRRERRRDAYFSFLHLNSSVEDN